MDYKFLSKINKPEDLKGLNIEQKNALCEELRDMIMNTVSSTGGHLASNLGVVELTVAIHSIFDSPKDSIIFDVGHQCYTHKLLTGRRENFPTLRQKDGVSGFMRPEESEHDPFVTGHSSNSISAACGIAKGNAYLKNGAYTVVVIGDGALTGGMALEGLNNLPIDNERLIIILNDNKMSISKNVGGFAKHLNKVRTNPRYYRLKNVIEKFVRKIPLVGESLRKSLYNSKLMLKNVVYHNNVFEGFGLNYLGPVDGHNVLKLEQVLQIAKQSKRPVIVHALTIKGKGYKYAEALPDYYHGVSPFNVDNGVGNGNTDNFSSVFGKTLCDIASTDEKVVAITAAMAEGTGLTDFSLKYPNRFFDVGIAEQHAVTFASGLASKGFKPYFAVYSSFLQRGFDQVFHDAAIAELPITLCIDRAGITGNDGETHQGIYDVAFLSAIPGVKIYSPSSYRELRDVIFNSAKREKGVVAIRYPRGKELSLDGRFIATSNEYDVFSKGDTAVVSYGYTFSECASALENTNVSFIKLNCINSISDDLIKKLSEYKKIFVFEESVISGSVGSAIADKLLENNYKGDFKHIAIDNCFVKQATQSEQRQMLGLDKESIIKCVNGEIDE